MCFTNAKGKDVYVCVYIYNKYTHTYMYYTHIYMEIMFKAEAKGK